MIWLLDQRLLAFLPVLVTQYCSDYPSLHQWYPLMYIVYDLVTRWTNQHQHSAALVTWIGWYSLGLTNLTMEASGASVPLVLNIRRSLSNQMVTRTTSPFCRISGYLNFSTEEVTWKLRCSKKPATCYRRNIGALQQCGYSEYRTYVLWSAIQLQRFNNTTRSFCFSCRSATMSKGASTWGNNNQPEK